MATAGMNPAYLLDPSLYGDQQAIDQQRQLAQLLMQQGLTPQGNSEVIGGVAIKRSPMEGAAKLAQILSGQGMLRDTNTASQDLMQRQAAAMAPMFGMGQQQPAQGSGPAMGAALGGQQPQAAQGAGPLSLPGLSPFTNLMSYSANPDQHMKALIDAASQTPEMKMAAQAYGVGSPMYIQALQDQVQKAGYIAPAEAKAGNLALDRNNRPIAYVPQVDKGMVPTFATQGGQTFPTGAQPLPGYAEGAAGIEGAQQAAKEANTIKTVPGANGAPVTGYGKDLIGGGPPPAPSGPKFTVGDPAEARAAIMRGTDPQERAMLLDAFDRQYPQTKTITGQTPGEAKGQVLSQELLDKRYTDLQAQNSTAQTTNSYLQTIKGLADKASTGRFTDKLQFANSILAGVPGINERATDAVTANNLLDKYSNQIVARLGQGGLGTDAARSILQSAYPNAHMTPEAIKEAADNLIGANSMVQAKARVLSDLGNKRDPVGYQEKEQIFDQNADPRMWQFATIKDPATQRAFMQKALKDDPQFLDRAAKLHAIGAL